MQTYENDILIYVSQWRDIFEASLEVEMYLTQGLSDLIGTATHSVLNITSYDRLLSFDTRNSSLRMKLYLFSSFHFSMGGRQWMKRKFKVPSNFVYTNCNFPYIQSYAHDIQSNVRYKHLTTSSITNNNRQYNIRPHKINSLILITTLWKCRRSRREVYILYLYRISCNI